MDIPLGHIDYDQFIQLVVNEDVRPERPDDDEALDMTDDLWSLAERCWVKDPLSRPSANIVCDDIRGLPPVAPLPSAVSSPVSPTRVLFPGIRVPSSPQENYIIPSPTRVPLSPVGQVPSSPYINGGFERGRSRSRSRTPPRSPPSRPQSSSSFSPLTLLNPSEFPPRTPSPELETPSYPYMSPPIMPEFRPYPYSSDNVFVSWVKLRCVHPPFNGHQV